MRVTTTRTDPHTGNAHVTILLTQAFLDLLPVLAITKVYLKVRERGARTGGINLKSHLQQRVQCIQMTIGIPS